MSDQSSAMRIGPLEPGSAPLVAESKNGAQSAPGSIFPWPPGLIVFAACMVVIALIASIAAGLMLAVRHDNALWTDHVFSRLTVQIMPEGVTPPPAEVAAAVALLRVTPGVASVDVMSASENAALVGPWLRSGESADGLPFPALIDVKLDGGRTLNLPALKQKLLESAPHAVFDDPRQAIGAAAPLTVQIFWMAAVVLAVSAVSFVLALTGFLRGWIGAQQHNAELLRLLGVSDGRIAGLIGRIPTASVGLTAATGCGLTVCLFVLRETGGLFPSAIPSLVPAVSRADLPWLAFIPVGAAIIAWVTCRLLVWAALRRSTV